MLQLSLRTIPTLCLTALACGGGGGGGGSTGPASVASVSVALARSSMPIGETTTASATTMDASGIVLSGRAVGWASDNNQVATVSSSGLVTAISAGTAGIIATSEGRSGTAALTVTTPPVASVTVLMGTTEMIVGSTAQAVATTKDAAGRVLTGRVVEWSSDNTAAATVSNTGLVSAVAGGSARIIATSEGQSGSWSLTVAASLVVSVTMSLASTPIAVGSRTQATARAKDANGIDLARAITFSSSNTSVATVTAQGVVTGVAVGTATISGTSEGQTGSATITVAPGISFGSSTEKLRVVDIGATFTPTLTGPSVASTTFLSRATSIATVDAGGTITGVSGGQLWVVASAPGWAADSVWVTVPRNTTGPVLGTDLTTFNVKAGPNTVVLNIIIDTRSTPIGGAELSVGFTTAPAVFLSPTYTPTGSPAPVISSLQPALVRVSLASGNPLSGQLSILRFTFDAPPLGSGSELLAIRSGFLTFTFVDLVSPTGADLLPTATSTRIPIIIR